MYRLLGLFLLLPAFCFAQNYKSSIGLRGGLGGDYGLSGKFFISGMGAIEGLLTNNKEYGGAYALYEHHTPVYNIDEVQFYFGGGLHAGSWHSGKYKNETAIGLDGILGVEYTFLDIPANISIDWKPEINATGPVIFEPRFLAISLRYTFKY